MLFCSVLVAGCLLCLAWAKEIVGVVVWDEILVSFRRLGAIVLRIVIYWQAKEATVTLAISCIYAVDFAINAGVEFRFGDMMTAC